MPTFKACFKEFVPASIKLNWRGESLLHQSLPEMVRYAKERGVLDVQLNTNATLLEPDKAQALMDAGLDWLIISVDGATKATYEKIRTGGNFETVCKNTLRTCLHYTVDNGPKTRVQICEQPDNKHEIEEWKRLFSPLATETRVGKLFDPQGKYGYELEKAKKFCPSFWRRLTIDWRGNIYPCPADYLGKMCLGNVNKDSLIGAWHSDHMSYFRCQLAKYGRKGVVICSKCASYC